MLAPLLELGETPWENEHEENRTGDFMNYQSYLLDLPLGQYIQRIYETERNA